MDEQFYRICGMGNVENIKQSLTIIVGTTAAN